MEKDKRPFGVIIPLLISQTIGALNDNGMKAMLPIMAAFQFGKDQMDQTNQMVSLLLIIPFVVFKGVPLVYSKDSPGLRIGNSPTTPSP